MVSQALYSERVCPELNILMTYAPNSLEAFRSRIMMTNLTSVNNTALRYSETES